MNIQAICEALSVARAANLDLVQMREVLLGGSAASWMLDRLGPAMIQEDVQAGFRIDLMLKDLFLAGELAREMSVPVPATALVTNQYLEARAHGEGKNGNQALFRVYDRMANRAKENVRLPVRGRPRRENMSDIVPFGRTASVDQVIPDLRRRSLLRRKYLSSHAARALWALCAREPVWARQVLV